MEVIIYGITSFLSQITLIREGMITLNGGEFIIIFIVSTWLITTSLSSYLSKKLIKKDPLEIKNLYHTISPLIIALQIITLRSKNMITPLGEDLNIVWCLLLSFVSTIQYTILSGIYFQKATQNNENIKIKEVYLLDCLGFISASILFYFLSEQLKVTNLFLIVYILNTIVIFGNKKYLYKSIIVLLASLVIINKAYSLTSSSKQLLNYYNTKYGKIEVYKVKDEKHIYYNSQRIYGPSDKEILYRKAISSIMFSQKNENSICFSNNAYLCQIIAEISKKNIYYIHYDRKLIELQEKIYGGLKDIDKIYESPTNFFLKNKQKFDLIVIDSNFPYTLSDLSIFSENFIKSISNSLTKDGVYVNLITFPKTPNQYQKKAAAIYISLLKRVFNSVEIFYDEFIVLVSFKGKIKINPKLENMDWYISYLYENRIKIDEIKENKFFSIYKATLLSELLRTNEKILKVLKKISKYKIVILILSLLTILMLSEKNSSLMFFSSFSSLFCQSCVITLYQINYGHIYKDISLILFNTMLGLYLGLNFKTHIKKYYYSIILSVISILPFLAINKVTLIVSVFITSFISGKIFNETSSLKGLTSYITDYLGSFFAIIFFKIWLFEIQQAKHLFLPILITSLTLIMKK